MTYFLAGEIEQSKVLQCVSGRLKTKVFSKFKGNVL
jgi:hypothetical protein